MQLSPCAAVLLVLVGLPPASCGRQQPSDASPSGRWADLTGHFAGTPATGWGSDVTVAPAARWGSDATVAPAAPRGSDVTVAPAGHWGGDVTVAPHARLESDVTVAVAAGWDSDATVAPVADWSDDVTGTPAAGSLRDRLLDVRRKLQAQNLRRPRRRHLKTLKRWLRARLVAERAQRRRQRHRERQLERRPRLQERGGVVPTSTWQQPDLPAEPTQPTVPGQPTTRVDTDERAIPAVADEGRILAEADERRIPAGADKRTIPVESAGRPAADVSGGGVLTSLWDWMSPAVESVPPKVTTTPAVESVPPKVTTTPAAADTSREQAKGAGWTVPPLPTGRRPNIVLVMTDDLDVELGSLNYMPKLRHFLQDEGVTFRHGYVSTPLCCPSRSSYLTGMFVHNHQVYTNRENCSSAQWQETHEKRTYAAYLQQAGYRTGYFGKYMNRYDGDHIPAGWDQWSALISNSKYYNYSMNVNGRYVDHGWQYPKDYLPLVVVNDSMAFWDESRRHYRDTPVLMVLSFPGPHGPEDAAPEYRHLFQNATEHHTPAYDFAPNADKQWFLRHVGKMDAVERTFTDILMTKRLQTLQSIDDAIETLYRKLSSAGELDNTYILFTSDHGYHLGQFGVAKGKSYPFEFDIRVPFVVRGPGIRAGSRSLAAVLNVDVAPTLLAMGGVVAPPQMDGRSIMPLLAATASTGGDQVPWPAAFIVEGAGKRPEQRRQRRLQVGVVRPGDSDVMYVSALQRLQEVCSQPEYSSPCRRYQKWACYHDGRRWRLQKCRRRRRRQQMCACRGGVVQGTRRIRARERHNQLRFLKEHMDGDLQNVRMRFVHELRERRSAGPAPTPLASPSDSLVKQFVVEEDFGRVDTSIWRTGQELEILQSHVISVGRCAADNTTCGSLDRENQRRLVRDQIRRLKQLLSRLKTIRRHLSTVSPREPPAGRRSHTFEDGDFVDYPDGGDHAQKELGYPEGGLSGGKTPARDPAGDDVAFCPCRPPDNRAERQWVREYTKQTLREEKAQLRKERRKQRRRRQRKKALLASQNCDFEGLNCFVHDNDHWKTPPLWTHGPVCICVGASNGTYDCLRTVSAADNSLFCRFVTGFLSFYDLTVDPYQLHNLAPSLSRTRLQTLDARLAEMVSCAGPDRCRPLPARPAPTPAGVQQPVARPPLEPRPRTAPPPAQPVGRTRRTDHRRQRRRGRHDAAYRQRQRRQQRNRARRMEWRRYRRRRSDSK